MSKDFIELLGQFIKFQSVSTDKSFVGEINKTAEFLATLFQKNGLKHEIIYNYSNPIVYAEYIHNVNLPTVLVYGHYDVQPASLGEGWYAEPFTLLQKDNKIYGRGVVDNKGQILTHIFTVINLIKEKNLKYNVKFLVEGDEESSSELLDKCIIDNKEKLKADFVFYSDGELTSVYPTIDVGYRGLINATLKVTTSTKDNHSGIYGGAIPNSALLLSRILSSLYDETFTLNTQGIDNSIKNIDHKIVENNLKLPFSIQEFKTNTGASKRLNESIDFYTQTGFLTSLEITGIQSGYTQDGYKNAVPGYAFAKFNVRISPNYKLEYIENILNKFFESKKKDFFDLNFQIDHKNEAIFLNDENNYLKEIREIASHVYAKECLLRYCGAIVPVAGIFKDILNIPVISVGLANEDCNMHGVNENFDIDLVKKGLEFSKKIFSYK